MSSSNDAPKRKIRFAKALNDGKIKNKTFNAF